MRFAYHLAFTDASSAADARKPPRSQSAQALMLSGLRHGARSPSVPGSRPSKPPSIVDDLDRRRGPMIPHDMDRSLAMPRIVIWRAPSRAAPCVQALGEGGTSRTEDAPAGNAARASEIDSAAFVAFEATRG